MEGRKKKVTFDINRYRDYAAHFSEGSHAITVLSGIVEDLCNRACDSTTAVDRVGSLLRKVMVRVFTSSSTQSGGGAIWWNVECQQARQHMLACRRQLGPGRVENKSGPVWDAFCQARSALNRAKRHARAVYDTERMREFVASCRHDQRALWRALGGKLRERCAISDINQFRDHFASLLNAGVGETGVGKAHGILNYISFFGEKLGEGAWRACRSVLDRRERVN